MRKPKKFAVIDCETDPFVYGRPPAPFIWGYFDGVEFKTFLKTSDMVAFIRTQKITIYAHNGGKFDYHFLLDHVNTYEQIAIINNRLSKLRIGECTLCDSFNLFPIPLSAYKKDEVDYSKFEARRRRYHMPEITNYLRGDCVYLHELVSTYRTEYGADLTQASGAMKTFQKMRKEKMPRHSDAALFAHFKQFYFGGRVQCFKTGIIKENFHVADINSAYPFAMTYPHPKGLDYYYGDREIPFSDTQRVFYRVQCVSRGAFPWRAKPTSGIDFPDDDLVREYCVSDWEYWTAKNARLISKVKIIECVVFPEVMNFSDYVTEFYGLRKAAKRDGDVAKDLLYKLRLNSLYGKFGSDYRKYENHIVLPNDSDITGYENVGDFGLENALFSAPIDEADMKFFNVATAASITGFVRAYLLAAMVRIGFDKVLYCDTDSVAALSIKNLRLGDNLGNWKNEGKFSRAGIAGKKLYIFQKSVDCSIFQQYKKSQHKKGEAIEVTKKACKGVRLTDGELWKVCRGGTVTHYKDAPSFSVTGKMRFHVRNIKITG